VFFHSWTFFLLIKASPACRHHTQTEIGLAEGLSCHAQVDTAILDGFALGNLGPEPPGTA
jgi:hypothetical protein